MSSLGNFNICGLQLRIPQFSAGSVPFSQAAPNWEQEVRDPAPDGSLVGILQGLALSPFLANIFLKLLGKITRPYGLRYRPYVDHTQLHIWWPEWWGHYLSMGLGSCKDVDGGTTGFSWTLASLSGFGCTESHDLGFFPPSFILEPIHIQFAI